MTAQGNQKSIHLKFEVPTNPSASTRLEFCKTVRLEAGPLGALLPLLLGTLCDLEQVTQLLFVLSFLICKIG